MPPDRDVGQFDERAHDYDTGWRATLHRRIVTNTVRIALALGPVPRRVLDVGCGTGILLEEMRRLVPPDTELVGIDAAPNMIEVARSRASDGRPEFHLGVAEKLPFPDSHFDLIVSTTSFDHWEDQQQGLNECARVLESSGTAVIADQFSNLLLGTLVLSRRGKARTKPRAERLLRSAGFTTIEWHDVYTVLIKAFSAKAP